MGFDFVPAPRMRPWLAAGVLIACGQSSGLSGSCVTIATEVVLHVALNGNDSNHGDEANPLGTLSGAQRQVQRLIANGIDCDVRVVIHNGTYFLEKPLAFGEADSMPPGLFVRFVAAQNETVVVSGGCVIDSWSRDDQGLWVADVKGLGLPGDPSDESNQEQWSSSGLRQLFQGELRLVRARSPNNGYFRVVAAGGDHRTSFQMDPLDWQPPSNLKHVELALLHDWSSSRVTMLRSDSTTNIIELAARVGAQQDFFRIDGFEAHPRYFVENSKDFLDADGEFFLDSNSGKLTVKLPDNMSPDRFPLVAPRLKELIQVTGTPEKPVRGLRFTGLQFRHTTCPVPVSGYAEIQASFFERRFDDMKDQTHPDPATESGHSRVPAACTVSFSEDCEFEECQFRQLGGGAIYLDRQTNHVKVVYCTVADVGGCGLMIGETLTRYDEQGRDLVCHQNMVSDCHVGRCGQILLGSVGIWVGIARDTRIENNEISELPYSGISVGWRWDAEPSGCAGNQIVNNHIHHVMQELSDGAGIYTLGLQPGTVLSGNRMHDIPLNAGRAESNGIFMDEGSTSIMVEGNLIWRTARSPIRFHKAGSNVIRGNRLFVDPGVELFTFNSTEPNDLTFEANEALDNAISPGSR